MAELYSQPVFQEPPAALEILKAYHLTYEFREELRYREQFQDYCQWYSRVSEQHRQEQEQMRGDINLFGWFCRKRAR